MTKVLQRFNMFNAKSVGSPLPVNCKLNSGQCPKTEKGKAEMRRVPYASVVGSLMYSMVCTRPDIVFDVGTVSRYMSNPRKEHWAVVNGYSNTSKVPQVYASGMAPGNLCSKVSQTLTCRVM